MRDTGPPAPADACLRYGCQEFREDAERVITGRAERALELRYEQHREHCSDCRRFHRRLHAVYSGPRHPIGPDAHAQESEFQAILRQAETLRSEQQAQRSAWYSPTLAWIEERIGERPWSRRSTLQWGSASVVLWLVVALVTYEKPGSEIRHELTEDETRTPSYAFGQSIIGPTSISSGLEHRSQFFGRVIGGSAKLERTDARTASPGTFRVGTTVSTGADETVQFALTGKMLVSMSENASVRWSHASAESIQLDLERGMFAVRYDRQVDEPILHVRTSNALVRVTGTVFTVEVTERGETSVSVLRGKVEVQDSSAGQVLAEVSAGYRFNSQTQVLDELGAREVAAALPLSDRSAGAQTDETPLIPTTWQVPGLPAAPHLRTLAQIPDPTPTERFDARRFGRSSQRSARDRRRIAARARARSLAFDEERIIQDLIAQAVHTIYAHESAAIADEIEREREQCTQLYAEADTRFLAATCLQRFLNTYPNHPRARSEGLVAIGILRMDYARDYQRAIHAFESFLKDYEDHPSAELVCYRLVLAHIESGDIQGAYSSARRYIQRFPNGAHLGHVIQRFPELKSMI